MSAREVIARGISKMPAPEDDGDEHDVGEIADAALAALAAAGLVVVPKEAAPGMCEAAWGAWMDRGPDDAPPDYRIIWRAMVAASQDGA